MITRRDFLTSSGAAMIAASFPFSATANTNPEDSPRVFVRLIEGNRRTDFEIGLLDMDFSIERQLDNPLDYRSNYYVFETGRIAKLRVGDRYWIMNGFDLESREEKKGVVFIMDNPMPYHPDTSYIVHVIGQGPLVVPNGR